MEADERFRRQYGLITRAQARGAGLSDRQVDSLSNNNTWIRVRHSVYRLAAVSASWESDLLAPILASGGVASHRCAATLWGLEVFKRPRPEITLPSSRRTLALPGVVVHHSGQWMPAAHQHRRGIPTTGPATTLMDCAGSVSQVNLERVAESAIRQGLTTWTELERYLIAHARRGRNGSAGLRELIAARAGEPGVPLSDFSRLVSNLLAEAGLPRPKLEYRITNPRGELVMQADLAWPELKMVWELDGLQWHFGRSDVERDRRKRNEAKALGWRIQEILWSMYSNEPAHLVDMARRFLTS